MICQSQIFLRQGINISWFFMPAAGSGMLQHTLYNCIGSFSMLVYFLLVFYHIIGNSFCLDQISFVNFIFISANNSLFTSEKLLTKFNGF